MTDHEWTVEFLHEYNPEGDSSCGSSEAGCAFWVIMIAAAIVVFVVLPHFGIDAVAIIKDLLP